MTSNTKTLLIVLASPNVATGNFGSVSRLLAEVFETKWKEAHPSITWNVKRRDLESDSPTGIDRHWAVYDKSAEYYKYSDEVIAEFRAADAVVIATPVHNFGPSALLKIYLDNLCRMGVTFIPPCCEETFNDPTRPWEGHLDDGTKPVFLLVSSLWNFSEGAPLAPRDHVVPWFKDAMDLVGVSNIYVVRSPDSMRFFGKARSTLLENVGRKMDDAIAECVKCDVKPRQLKISPCHKCANKACSCGDSRCAGCDIASTAPESPVKKILDA